jgi:hypothetical protein
MKTPPNAALPVPLQRIVQHLGKFPSCAIDRSGDVWPEEAECVAEMQRGTELIAERAYLEATDDYGVSFYWCEPDGKLEYPRCRDGVVMRLMGREVVKPVTCGGGRTWICFTDRAAKKFLPNNKLCDPAP